MTTPRLTGPDDVLRYAYRQGAGRDFVAPLGPPERPLTSSFGTIADAVATDRWCPLVWGTVDLLADTTYPGPCSDLGAPVAPRLQHALVMAFGLQRREPSNLFNDHRGYASVRSRFPVHVYLHTDEHAWLLDGYRHGLLPIGDAGPTFPDATDASSAAPAAIHSLSVALAGRFTHLPSLYGRLRGPLTELELGISLRALCVALDVVGLRGELQLPGPGVGPLMARLALDPRAEWTVPLTVAIGPSDSGAGPAPAVARAADGDTAGDRDDDDPTLAEVVAVNRASLATVAAHGPGAGRGWARALPGLPVAGPDGRSWSDVLWDRNAGRMPRQLAGVSGRRRLVTGELVRQAVAWVSTPPPTALLAAVARRITVSGCLQDVEGWATGWYRLGPADDGGCADNGSDDRGGGSDALGARRLELVAADPTLPARLEACYGHGLNPTAGCAVRHANAIWLLTADVTSLVADFGPGAWTLAQYAAGWMAHGLCLAAAAHGRYARPNRAFDEILLQPVVALTAGEMVLLSVVSGAGRFLEPTLDLRT